MIEQLASPMTGDNCRAELFTEEHRGPLKAACAEDRDTWSIYALNFGPDAFDESIDLLVRYTHNHTFVLFDGDELAGMSSFIGIDRGRRTLEIGSTYYRPHQRGTGFNRRVKQMMLERAFSSGIRRVEFRACSAPTASPGPAMSATRCCSPSSPTNGRSNVRFGWKADIAAYRLKWMESGWRLLVTTVAFIVSTFGSVVLP
jgi:predicted GNAT family acetyltransferase